MPTRVVILASGRGSDFQAIADHLAMGILENVSLVGLICNHKDAPVIGRAQTSRVPSLVIEGVSGTHFSSRETKEAARLSFDKRCVTQINELCADLIVLAGFDQILSAAFVEEYKFKILNVHPAYDLKRFGGKNMVGRKVHELVLKAGVSYSGCTIHYVTSEVDAGPVLLKKRVEISKSDTLETLESKILREEHLAYPEAIQLVADGRVKLDELGKRCYVDRFSDGWDIDWDARQQSYIAAVQEKF